MNNEINPTDYPNDADYHEKSTQKENFIQGIKRASEDHTAQNGEANPDSDQKPPFVVRFIHFLWRRRRWKKIRKDDRPGANWAEITTVCVTTGVFLAACIQAYIYWRQADLMEKGLTQNVVQLAIANRNANIAQQTLGEMKSGGVDTHNLTLAAGDQAKAAKTTAGAAQSAAITAKDTLHISERAYIGQTFQPLDYDKSLLTMNIINSGRIPSGKVDIISYEATFNVPHITLEGEQTGFEYIVERHKGITHLDVVPPGSPVLSATFPIPQMARERLGNGTQMVMVIGAITYNDGFPKSPSQTFPFCAHTIYQTVAKTVYIAPCNATTELPKFEAMDWNGLTSEYP